MNLVVCQKTLAIYDLNKSISELKYEIKFNYSKTFIDDNGKESYLLS